MNKGNVWLKYFTQDVTNLKLKKLLCAGRKLILMINKSSPKNN